MTSVVPSIKGSALARWWRTCARCATAGGISADQLEARLEAADLALLDGKVQPALWYPIESYRRLTELLLDLAGRGDPHYVADRGARAAQRLWESGLYVQLQHGEEKAAKARRSGRRAERARRAPDHDALGRDLQLHALGLSQRGRRDAVIEVSEAEGLARRLGATRRAASSSTW